MARTVEKDGTVELEHAFELDTVVGLVWRVLTDPHRLAACVPGATLTGMDGEEWRGELETAVGPVLARYRGAVEYLEVDEAAYTLVLRGVGRDSRGQGNASATVRAVLEPRGETTAMSCATSLSLTGKVARLSDDVVARAVAGFAAKVAGRLGQLARHIGAAGGGAGTTRPR